MTQVRGGISFGAVVALAYACVLAQWQVNPQVGGQVNNRVGGEMYGNMGSVKYAPYQTVVLPSEARYAAWRSGALPSEMRMNAAAVGPLAPNGAIAYVPGPSPVQQAYKTPPTQLYNPAYGIENRPIADQLAPQPGFASGSVKYASTNAPTGSASMAMTPPTMTGQQAGQMSTGQVPTRNIPSGQPALNTGTGAGLNMGQGTPGAQLFSQSPANLGSIRYESLPPPAQPSMSATKPATRPAAGK